MTEGRTCQEWLEILDALEPSDEQWQDPEFVGWVSWLMLTVMWRRMNQRLLDTGFAIEKRPEYR